MQKEKVGNTRRNCFVNYGLVMWVYVPYTVA